jgi:hypothetical protein
VIWVVFVDASKGKTRRPLSLDVKLSNSPVFWAVALIVKRKNVTQQANSLSDILAEDGERRRRRDSRSWWG